MRDMGVVELALAYAARAYSGMTLRGTKLPYVVHPADCLSIASGLTEDPEVLAAAVLQGMPGNADSQGLSEIFSPRVAALVKEAMADRPADASSDNWLERKSAAIQRLETAPREVLILVTANRLSDLRVMAGIYAREGDGLWKVLNRKDPQAQAWFYGELLRVLRPLEGSPAYREMAELYATIFGKA